jgi:hypothetical protein
MRAGAFPVLALLWLAPASAADLPIAPRGQPAPPAGKDLDKLTPPPRETSPAGEGWWPDVVRRFPGCTALSDGCRICTKDAGGFTCSNTPIACQPKEWTCSRQ